MKRKHVAAIVYLANGVVMAFWLWGAGGFDFHWDCGEDVPCYVFWWVRVVPDLGCAIFAVAALVVLFHFRTGIILGIVAAQIFAIKVGYITASKFIVSFVLQVLLLDIFVYGLIISGNPRQSSGREGPHK